MFEGCFEAAGLDLVGARAGLRGEGGERGGVSGLGDDEGHGDNKNIDIMRVRDC